MLTALFGVEESTGGRSPPEKNDKEKGMRSLGIQRQGLFHEF